MKFWDTSALVPLLVEERQSAASRARLQEDPRVLVWWGTRVECAAAVQRAQTLGRIRGQEADALAAGLDALTTAWDEVLPEEAVRTFARRLARTHDGLRAADAFQLAAALVACEGDVESLDVVCIDERLAAAARREGFRVLS